MKLQKYMSQAGICSRRKAEKYIAAGEVFVNNEEAHIGQIIDTQGDVVTLGSGALLEQKEYVYYKFNKPRGVETTCAQKGGKSIIDIIESPQRIFPIGRLDKETTGLILLTNDGRITQSLTHPSYEHEKEYVVETFGRISDTSLESMRSGMMILGKMTKPCVIQRMAAGKFSIILTEGRNRQIRRMVEMAESRVKKLKRIRVETIKLGSLAEGQLQALTKKEKETLFRKINIQLDV